MPNSRAAGYGVVSRHLWLLLWESSSLLDSCIYLKVFLCWVQIYHLDPKRECWGLLGKEQEATTEILWPKGILKEPHDVAEESGAKGGGGGGEGECCEPWKWRGEGLLHVVWGSYPTWPFHYDHHPPTSLCAQPFFCCLKDNFPQPHSPCMLEPGRQHRVAALHFFQMVTWSPLLMTAPVSCIAGCAYLQVSPDALSILAPGSRACLVLSPCRSSRVTPGTGGVTLSCSILAPPCFFLSVLAGHCLDRSPCRIWNYKPWSSFLQRWTSIFSTSCFPLDLLCDSISTFGAFKVFLFLSKPESLLA